LSCISDIGKGIVRTGDDTIRVVHVTVGACFGRKICGAKVTIGAKTIGKTSET